MMDIARSSAPLREVLNLFTCIKGEERERLEEQS
jgi:hypothetical protein